MTAISGITTALKKFSGKPLAITSNVIAAASVASVIYDAHISGKEESVVKYERDVSNKLYNNYKQYIGSSSGSATVAQLKKWWYNTKQDYTLDNQASRVVGYASGAMNKIGPNLPVLGLSAIALLGKKIFCKLAGGLLALNAAKIIASDVIFAPYKKENVDK